MSFLDTAPGTATDPSLLMPSELDAYRTTGFVHLPGRFEAGEVAAWRAECDRLLTLQTVVSPDNLRIESVEQNGRMQAWKFDPVVDLSPVIAALSRDPRITGPLRSIYGEEPLLFKDKLIYKPPGTHGNGMHQDWNWWQPFPQNLITVTVAIDGGTRENGCTEVFSGWDRGFLHVPGKREQMAPGLVDESTVRYFASCPGDIGLFHCLTPHRAGENHSEEPRRQLFLTYGPASNGDLYEAHYRHYHHYITERLGPEEKARKIFR